MIGTILAILAGVGVFVPLPAAPALSLLAAIAAALLLEPAALRRAWGARTLALLALAAVTTGALVAWSSGPQAGTTIGVAIYLRLLVFVLLVALASRHLNAEGLVRAARRVRAERLALVLGLALNALPHLGEAWRDAWIALGVRRRRTTPRLRDGVRLLETLLAHTGRVAEEAAAAASLRGHRSLAAPSFAEVTVPHLIVVTGPPGGGKTSNIIAAARTLSERGVALGGFVQPAIVSGGEKSGFTVRDLATGEERALAVRVSPGNGDHGTGYRFDPDGFALARRSLERAPSGGVLVIDEVGPVELRGAGHMSALRRAIRRKRPVACLLAVRRALIPALLARLAAPSVTIVDVETVDDPVLAVAAAVLQCLEARQSRPATA